MPTSIEAPPKPRSTRIRPELTRLPELTPERLAYRARSARICAWFVNRLTRPTFAGLEHLPEAGPGLLVINHLGDADIFVILAGLGIQPDALAKSELYDLPLAGRWMDRYGAIWVHRGTADRRAIRTALEALAEGRFVGLAPEGRQSVTGSLEEATSGAAYIALKSGAPVIPVALTGTENRNIFGSWLRLRRPVVTMTIGEPFSLDQHESRSAALEAGTERIMRRLAGLLPEAYRGVYGAAG